MQTIKAKQGIHRKNNAHFDAMKLKNNSHLTVHSLYLLMGINCYLPAVSLRAILPTTLAKATARRAPKKSLKPLREAKA